MQDGPAHRVVGFLEHPVERSVCDRQRHAPVCQPGGHVAHLEPGNGTQLQRHEGVEDHHLVQPVQQLGPGKKQSSTVQDMQGTGAEMSKDFSVVLSHKKTSHSDTHKTLESQGRCTEMHCTVL